jgi:hypothetical protein
MHQWHPYSGHARPFTATAAVRRLQAYNATVTILTEQDELGIYHALRLHDRVRHIHLHLPPSILHKVLVLMDEHFPILEHLSLSFRS